MRDDVLGDVTDLASLPTPALLLLSLEGNQAADAELARRQSSPV